MINLKKLFFKLYNLVYNLTKYSFGIKEFSFRWNALVFEFVLQTENYTVGASNEWYFLVSLIAQFLESHTRAMWILPRGCDLQTDIKKVLFEFCKDTNSFVLSNIFLRTKLIYMHFMKNYSQRIKLFTESYERVILR